MSLTPGARVGSTSPVPREAGQAAYTVHRRVSGRWLRTPRVSHKQTRMVEVRIGDPEKEVRQIRTTEKSRQQPTTIPHSHRKPVTSVSSTCPLFPHPLPPKTSSTYVHVCRHTPPASAQAFGQRSRRPWPFPSASPPPPAASPESNRTNRPKPARERTANVL